MKFIHFWLIVTSMLSISTTPLRPVPDPLPEISFGLMDAAVGVNHQTGTPSGWYTSDVTLHILTPADVLANGKLLPDGQLTIADEGQHQVELQPGPAGRDNLVTQFVNIDKTPPAVTWLTEQNSTVSGDATLSAEVSDQISGICSIQASFNHGHSWESQNFPAPVMGEPGTIRHTTWSAQLEHREFSSKVQVVLLRAQDCAGNVSPGELLVFRVQ
jgi:hypothetical protein